MKVKAIKHLNVYEKEQYYIQLNTDNGNQRYTINVGEKTYSKIKEMLNEEQNPIQHNGNTLDNNGTTTIPDGSGVKNELQTSKGKKTH